MINQYHDDMAEIERLQALLTKCKTSGCNQADVGGDDIFVGPTTDSEDPSKKYHRGAIRFPDCGLNISSECFWNHYLKSDLMDFLSFFMYIPALLGCAIAPFDDYEYSLCLSNFAYIVVDGYSRRAAPPQ